MKKFIFYLLPLFLLFSCNHKDDFADEGKIEIDSPISLQFNHGGGVMYFSFSANMDWTSTVTTEWINYTPKSGSNGTNTIVVTVGATTDYREGIITLKCGTDEIDVSVTQDSANQLD